jgi:hypothetical protein
MLRIGIIGWSNLHNIRRNEIDPFKSANDGTELARGPSASFRGASSGSNFKCKVSKRGLQQISKCGGNSRDHTGRVERVNVNTQVDWFLRPYALPNFVYYAMDANRVNFPSFNDFEAAISVVLVVARP